VRAVHFLDTGVPHAVVPVGELEKLDVAGLGRSLRFHKAFGPKGANVDFVKVSGGIVRVRTYERGVEDETLACGTGSVASALIAARKGLAESPVDVRVQGGELLRIYFEMTPDGFAKVYLEGKAKVVYQGTLWDEAWKGR